MRKLRRARFVPLAFIAGVEGFCFFAPYLVLFLAVALFVRQWQQGKVLAAAAAAAVGA